MSADSDFPSLTELTARSRLPHCPFPDCEPIISDYKWQRYMLYVEKEGESLQVLLDCKTHRHPRDPRAQRQLCFLSYIVDNKENKKNGTQPSLEFSFPGFPKATATRTTFELTGRFPNYFLQAKIPELPNMIFRQMQRLTSAEARMKLIFGPSMWVTFKTPFIYQGGHTCNSLL